MKIAELIRELEAQAPPALQESYDNAGLITGDASWDCTGVLCTLDATEAVMLEAKEKGCNLVVAHHPIVFGGLKKFNGKNYVERAVIAAIKNDIAVYAIHTNLDNVLHGVNAMMADKLGLINRKILAPKGGQLRKLSVFVPQAQTEAVQSALFAAGAGHIGQYSECSFTSPGTGSFKAGAGTNPFVGEAGKRHLEPENKVEVIYPVWLEGRIIAAMKQSHPYEEVAYDIFPLNNDYQEVGSGLIGQLPESMTADGFLSMLKTSFGLAVIRHTQIPQKTLTTIALCGGAGSFLTKAAIAAGADAYVTAEIKYHEFFDAENKLLLADIGHWESEQYTIDLLVHILQAKFPTFAVLQSRVRTNPVYYYS